MKKLIFLLMLLLLTISLTVSASADVLWEPYGDIFYNRETADLIDQFYYVPEGSSVKLYRSPVFGGAITTMEAGTRVYVGYTQNYAGELWGIGYPLTAGDEEGWFRIDRLQIEYNHSLFCQEYGSEFTEYQGQLADYEVQEVIYTWTYPGSGVNDGRIFEIEDADSPSFVFVYTDPDGGQWGYVGYHMGHCGWVYLDDPENPEPPLFPQTPPNTTLDTAPEHSPGWPIGLVAAVVLATALIIVFLKRKKTV